MVNVSLKILVASSGLTMVGKSFSNQITLVSFLTVSFHSVCGKRQVNTPTHMQRNRVQTQITAKHYHAFFRGQTVALICISLMMSNDSVIITL